MQEGTLQVGREELDLDTTMQVGQTFAWHRVDGSNLYGDGEDRYYTTKDGDVLVLWQKDDLLHYRATGGMEDEIEDRLRLHESLDEITSRLQGTDPVLDEALDRYRGLRVLNDDVFPCLISYLCSVQMRIPRIKKLYDTLAREYGETIEAGGREFLQFPSVEQLAAASEQELRDLGVGYRAKYIAETTDQLRDGLVDLDGLAERGYREAHGELTELYGVGDKVADCVALFGCGHLEAVPIDTWIRTAVEEHYPQLHDDDYHAMADNLREFFAAHPGYAQEYLFHHIRNGDVST
ncbi:MAG: DNA glycosylase [Candidatus Nanohaloarchaea archaeon]|nr:DNA glycosylase [Candidatus Nanohaloarchaea archaeon]